MYEYSVVVVSVVLYSTPLARGTVLKHHRPASLHSVRNHRVTSYRFAKGGRKNMKEGDEVTTADL